MVDFTHALWQILLELSPWLLLGTAAAGVLHVLLPANFLERQLAGKFGICKAVLFGVPLPLCSCAVIPLGLSLKQNGASRGSTIAFLISTPQTGIDSALVSASFLGWPFALFKVLSATVMGLIGGWLTDRKQELALPIVTHSAASAARPMNHCRAFFEHCLEMLRSIWRWLLLGILVSAALTTWVPAGMLTSFTGGNDWVALVATLVVALPLYVCATASVPIAAALVANGLPPGAALVFLMAGPATNVATIGAVARALGRRASVIYLTTVIVGSIACGWLFSFLLQTTAFRAPEEIHSHSVTHGWNTASAVVLVTLLCWFAAEEMLRRDRAGHAH